MDAVSFVYWENENLYLAWKGDMEKNWNHTKLPEEYYAAYGIMEGVFFYEAVDPGDEEEEILPFYKTMCIVKMAE